MKTFLGRFNEGLADIIDAEELINIIYPNDRVSENTAKLARIFCQKLGISKHSTVLNLKALPRKIYARPNYHPVLWGAQLFRESIPDELVPHIGGVITTYNISSHSDVLPSISGRLEHFPLILVHIQRR